MIFLESPKILWYFNSLSPVVKEALTTEISQSLLPSDKSNKAGENQSRCVKFGDTLSGKISRVVGNKGFWSSNKCRYERLEDAIIAEYAYQKYNKIREKGRMHGVLY